MTRESLTIDGAPVDLEAAPLLMDIRAATDISILGVDISTHEDNDRYISGGGTLAYIFETSEDAEQFIDLLVQTDPAMLDRYAGGTQSDRGDWGVHANSIKMQMECGHEHVGVVVMVCFPLLYLKRITHAVHQLLYPNGIEGEPDADLV